MKNLKKYDASEMSIEEQRALDGGVMPDKNGKGCTEQGIPDILIRFPFPSRKPFSPTNEF